MSFKPTTFFIIFFIFVIITTSLTAQNEKFIIDTIYSDVLFSGIFDINKSILLSGKGQKSIIFREGEIKPYIKDRYNWHSHWGEPQLIEFDGKCYKQNIDFSIDNEKYVNLSIGSLSRRIPLMVEEDYITYLKGDSMFVANFITHKSSFVMLAEYLLFPNKNYITVGDFYSEDRFMYVFESKRLRRIPAHFQFTETDHPHFFLHDSFVDTLTVRDLELHEIVTRSEEFTDYAELGDILAVYGNGKSAKIFHIGELLEFEDNYIEIDCRESQNVCYLTNEENKVSVINSQGQFIFPFAFDKVIFNKFFQHEIILVKEKVMRMYDNKFKLIFEGVYDDMKLICENRILVKKGHISTLVNLKGEAIIPNTNFTNSYLSSFDKFGPIILKSSRDNSEAYYDIDGNEIRSWKFENNKTNREIVMGLRWSFIKSLTNGQEDKINPSKVWIKSSKRGRRKLVYACDRRGIRLSHNYKSIMKLGLEGDYLVTTFNNRRGVINIKN